MFQIKATVVNTYTMPATDKRPEAFKAQLMGDIVAKDGQIRKDMVTISCPQDVHALLEKHLGQVVTMPVGIFVSDGRIQPYFPKQGAGMVVTSSGAQSKA